MTEQLTLKMSDGLYGGSAGLKGKRVLLLKFLLNRKRCCFSMAGKINTNPNKQHKDECVLLGTWGAWLTMRPVSGEQGESFLWRGQHLGRWGRRGAFFRRREE